MAAGSQRQYNATFAIGAKLLGSFRGVMAQAQKRLEGLRHTAMHAGESILKVFERLGVGLSLFAGFAAGKVFQSIFEGASEEAAAAEQRTRRLSILLMQHNQIRQRGLEFARRQTALIFEQNEAYSRQGVIGKEALDAAATQLAIFGYAPKRIAGMMKPLSDVLVTAKGVNATQEDAAGLADAWGRAVRTGMVKPLRQYGFILSDVESKEFKGLKNAEKRNQWILRWANGFKGVNAEAAKTDLGKIARFHNEMKELSQDIGQRLLPAQAAMAAAWSKALPALKPIAVRGITALVNGATGLAGVVTNRLVPAWHEFQGFLDGPLGSALSKLRAAWNDMVTKLGPAFANMFSQLTGHAMTFKEAAGNLLLGALDKLSGALKYIGDNASWLVPLITTLTGAFYAASIAIGVTNAVLALSPIGWVIIGITGLVAGIIYLHQQFGTLTNALKALWEWLQKLPGIGPLLTAQWEGIKQGWENIKTAFEATKPVVVAVFQAIGQAIQDSVLAPIHAIQGAWSASVDFIKNHVPTWAGGTPAPPVPVVPAAQAGAAVPKPPLANVPGMATGGIIRGHSLLQIAERGPEAVIPLAGGRRAEGLLNYASRAIGMGRVTNHGDMHLNYAPQITINGNASETEQRALDSMMRKQHTDLIADLKAAQAQERRLSFDSAYS